MSNDSANVFISHIHEDDAELPALKDLLSKNGFQIRDSSINSSTPNDANDPNYIKKQILAPKIDWAGTMIVLISPKTHESEWVDWEIAHAHQKDKRIVGVWAHGAKDCDIPKNLELADAVVVGWQGDRIIDAIRGNVNDWQTTSGDLRRPRGINRFGC
jgi:hypothetical protein